MADYATFDKISKDITNNIVPRLSELFEKDAILFDAVITLRRLRDKSKSDEKKSDFKRLAIELLEPANDCIFEITEICLSLIDYGNLIFEKGWRFVKGDSGAAISAAISGVVSGICIISLNFETLGPREYSRENMQKFARLYSSMQLKHCDALNAANSIHDKAMDALKQPQPQH